MSDMLMEALMPSVAEQGVFVPPAVGLSVGCLLALVEAARAATAASSPG